MTQHTIQILHIVNYCKKWGVIVTPHFCTEWYRFFVRIERPVSRALKRPRSTYFYCLRIGTQSLCEVRGGGSALRKLGCPYKVRCAQLQTSRVVSCPLRSQHRTDSSTGYSFRNNKMYKFVKNLKTRLKKNKKEQDRSFDRLHLSLNACPQSLVRLLVHEVTTGPLRR
jgi:hypothetical protein